MQFLFLTFILMRSYIDSLLGFRSFSAVSKSIILWSKWSYQIIKRVSRMSRLIKDFVMVKLDNYCGMQNHKINITRNQWHYAMIFHPFRFSRWWRSTCILYHPCRSTVLLGSGGTFDIFLVATTTASLKLIRHVNF